MASRTLIRTLVPALAVMAGQSRADGTGAAQGGGAPFPIGIAVHVSRASNDVRSNPAAPGAARPERPRAVRGASGGGLVIYPTFDSSVTDDVNSAHIQAVVQSAVDVYEALFSDPISVSILFRYSTMEPDGKTHLPAGTLALTVSTLYIVPWAVYTDALATDATTTNDAAANATLPVSPLSTHIQLGSANGRAVGRDTPPALFADGTLGTGGQFDSIITLNSGLHFSFARPVGPAAFDALRVVEHEMDEALGLGSYLNTGRSDLRPQDLFGWSAPGVRNLITSGVRYFSIDVGVTDIIGMNQSAGADFGDWSSGACPNESPFVQDAFTCPGEVADLTSTSPEGVNLDVIGYDGAGPLLPTPTATVDPTIAATATGTATSTPTPPRSVPTSTATPAASPTPGSVGTATPVPSGTGSPATPPVSASVSPTSTAGGTCVGDCSGTRVVSIGNLITLVNIALGNAQLEACAHGLPNGAQVTIALLVQAVNDALNGCTA